MTPSEGQYVHGKVVRVKGVPPKASVADVLDFFSEHDLSADAVQLVFKERRTAGEALVVFNSEEDALRACDKDKDLFAPEKFGQRYVRVIVTSELNPEEIKPTTGDTAAASSFGNGSSSKSTKPRRTAATSKLQQHPGESSFIRIGGLPAAITVQEVMQLFWRLPLKPTTTYLHKPAVAGQQRYSEAFVDLGAPEQANIAIESWNGTRMTTQAGVFSISVQRASRAEYEAARMGRPHIEDIIKVRGLPVKATAADVANFFINYSIKPNGIHLQQQQDNKHSKYCFVEFSSPEEASRAMEKDRHQFNAAVGDRYCLLHLISRTEFEQEIRNTRGKTASNYFRPGVSGSSDGFNANTASNGMFPSGAMRIAPSFGMSAAAAMDATWNPAAAMAAMGFTPAFPMPAQSGMMPMMPSAAAFQAASAWPGMQPPSALPANSAAARYMVQDLSTGQKVYLDPRFNVYPTATYGSGNMNQVPGSYATQQSETVKSEDEGSGKANGTTVNNGSSGRSEQTNGGNNNGSSNGDANNTPLAGGKGKGGDAGPPCLTPGSAAQAHGDAHMQVASLHDLAHKRTSTEVALDVDVRPAKHKTHATAC